MPLYRLIVNSKLLIVKSIAVLLILLAPLTFSSLISDHSSLVLGQSPLELSKENYSLQLTKLNDAHEAYITAKSNYLSFKSATAKNDAFIKTKEYLHQVDELLTLYLKLVRSFSDNANWQSSNFSKEEQNNIIQEESAFVSDHQAKIDKATTLEELTPLAKDLKTHLEESTNPRINKIIVTLDIVQTQSTSEKFNQLSARVNEFVASRIKADNKSLLINWQSETANIKEKTQNNLNLVLQSFTKIKDDRNNLYQVAQTLKVNKQAKDELKKSKDLFEEMLKVI